MPATTTTLKLPYPLDSDRLEDFPTIAKQTAQLLDQAATVKTATLPVFDNAWRHEGDSGIVRTANNSHQLTISLVRAGGGFHMDGNSIIDIMRVNNLVAVPSTREWVMCGSIYGPGIWPMPVFLNSGLVRVFVPGPVDIQQNGAYRGFASWVA